MRRLALLLAAACAPDGDGDDAPVDDSEAVDTARPSACPRLRDALRDCWGVAGIALGPRAAPWMPIPAEQHLIPGDIDGDGLPDLLSTEILGPTRLWRNLGGFRFEDVTEAWGLDVPGAWGAALGDLDRDGDLDLVVTSPRTPDLAAAWATGTLPDATFVVLENAGDGFVDRTEAWGFSPVACADACTFVGAALHDLNADGVLDVVPIPHVSGSESPIAWLSDGPRRWVADGERLARSRGEHYAAVVAHLDDDDHLDFLPVINFNLGEGSWPRLLRGTGSGFVEQATGAASFGDDPVVTAFTGAAATDFDQDGDVDLAFADYREVRLLRARGDGTYDEEVLADDRPSQGIAWFDHDGDGWEDLWVLLGVTDRQPLPVGAHRLWRNDRGVLGEAPVPFEESEPAGVVGVAISDLDRDGRPDLVLGGAGARPRLLRNGFRGRWLGVALAPDASPPAGLGAQVTVEAGGRRLTATMGAGGAKGTASEAVLWFGLGDAEAAEVVTVRWPSGAVGTWREVPAGLRVLGEGEP